MNMEAPAAPAVDAGQAQGQGVETVSKSWFDGAPDEVKGFIQTKGWTEDPLKAVMSYQELEKFRGASEDQLIKLPKDPKAEGAYDDVWKKLGRPESPDKYELNLPQTFEVEFDGNKFQAPPIDPERLSWAKKIGHEIGLNSSQLQRLVEETVKFESAIIYGNEKQYEQEVAAQQSELKSRWGAKYDERVELGRRAFRAVGDQDAIDKMESVLGHAKVTEMFAKIGEAMGEDKIHDASDSGRSFGYTKEQAAYDRSKLMREIQADQARLTNFNNRIGNDVSEMERLNKIIANG